MILELFIKALVGALVDMLANLLVKLLLNICSIIVASWHQGSSENTGAIVSLALA